MYEFTITEEGNVIFSNGTEGIIYNEKIKEIVRIRKLAEKTETPLAGAVIGLYDKDGNELKDENENHITVTTNENGEVAFTLESGTYKYKELQPPSGYLLNDNMYEFTVSEDGEIIFADGTLGIIYDERVTAKATIQKFEIDTEVPLAGAIIGIYDKNGNEVTLTTDNNGKVEIMLEPGEYTYKEIQAPKGYSINNTIYKLTVLDDGTIEFENDSNGIIYDRKAEKYDVVIRKYQTGTTNALKGAVIGIYDDYGNKIEVITDINGEAISKLEPGTYKYKELQAPNGYILDDKEYEFTIKENGTVIFANNTYGIIYNEKILVKYPIIIKKQDAETSVPLEGAVIGLYDKQGKELKDSNEEPIRLISDEIGQITIELEPGEYQYKELQPPQGYILDDKMYSVIVREDGKIEFIGGTDGIIYNFKLQEQNKGKVTIRKYIEDTVIPLKGAVIGIYNSDGDFVKLTTDDEGKVELELEAGEYQYQEIEAPPGYILNEEIYKFVVSEDGIITFLDEANGIIYNEREISKYKLNIRKYETGTSNPLEGALIRIYDAKGKELTDDNGNPIQITTDNEGEAYIELEPGEYQYREIQAPNGYKLNYEVYSFVINYDGTIRFLDEANGVIYDDKIEDSSQPSEPSVPNNPDIPSKPDGGHNTNLQGNVEDLNNKFNSSISVGNIPYAGSPYALIVMIVATLIMAIYFGIKGK